MRHEIIRIENLCKNYGSVKAVDNISFSVERGSMFSFLGVNGAGKSTTINIICSILSKDAGKVYVDGFDLDTSSAKIKPKIGIVFQNTVLDTLLPVYDNLCVRASYYGLKGAALKKRIAELTDLLSLEDILKRPFGKLSGGQKRRADIARGLINKPNLLILDEPTTGLDPQTRKTVWQIIERLRKEEGMTVFLTTHYMEEADLSDSVVVIDSGKIVADDTPVNLKNTYSGNYLILHAVSPEMIRADASLSRLKYEALNTSLKVSMPDADEAKRFLNSYPALCHDFEFVKGNMDDVFLNVTGKRLEGR